MFMKHYHAENLTNILRKHREALIFMQKITKGFIARKQFKVILAAKRAQDELVRASMAKFEDGIRMLFKKITAQADFDSKDKDNRIWLKTQAEQEKAAAAAKAAQDKIDQANMGV